MSDAPAHRLAAHAAALLGAPDLAAFAQAASRALGSHWAGLRWRLPDGTSGAEPPHPQPATGAHLAFAHPGGATAQVQPGADADRAALQAALAPWVANALGKATLAGAVRASDQAQRLQAALFALADMAGSELDTRAMLDEVHAIVGRFVYADNFYLALVDEAAGTFRFIYLADTDEQEFLPFQDQVIPMEQMRGGLTWHLVHGKKPLRGTLDSMRTQIDGPLRLIGKAALDWMGVPIVMDGCVRAVLAVQAHVRRPPFTATDQALLAYVGSHIVTALDRKQAREDLERRVQERTQALTLEVAERQRTVRLQETLYRIAELAASGTAPDAFFAAIHRLVGEHLDARNFYIALVDEQGDDAGGEPRLTFAYYQDESGPAPVGARLGRGVTAYVLRTGQPLLYEQARHQALRDDLMARGEVESMGRLSAAWLGVPLLADGQVLGVMVVQSYDPDGHFSEADRDLLTYIAQQVASGLIRQRANAALQQRVAEVQRAAHRQETLYRIAELAASATAPEAFYAAIHALVGEQMDARNFYIALVEASSPDPSRLRYAYYADERGAAPRAAGPLPTGVSAYVVRSGQAVLYEHGVQAHRDQVLQWRAAGDVGEVGPEPAAWLGVPLVAGEQAIGVMVVHSGHAGSRFTEADRDLLTFISRQVASGLMRQRAHAALQQRVAEVQRAARLQETLYRAAELAASAAAPDAYYAAIHRLVGEHMDARNFYIALLDPGAASSSRLRYAYHADELEPAGRYGPMEHGVAEHVVRTGVPFLYEDARPVDRAQLERWIASGEVGTRGPPPAAWLGVPLVADDDAVGIMVVQGYRPGVRFGEADRDLLVFISRQVASGLVRQRAAAALKAANASLEQRVAERTHALREQIAVREMVEQRLQHDARHDALTGLPNRAYLLEELLRNQARRQRDPAWRYAVLFMDLDRFKVINDSAGHIVGDQLLQEVAARFTACVRSPDIVARLGGDEFAMLVHGVAQVEDALRVAERALAAVSAPVHIQGKEFFTGVSIGVALSSAESATPDALLRDADIAMYRAKSGGRARIALFDEGLHAQAQEQLQLEDDLRRAVAAAGADFEPWFQPIVRLADGAVLGYEALMRWRHPARGVLAPGAFLPAAEAGGTVEVIDWAVFTRTCELIPRLLQPGQYVNLNCSPRHFRGDTLDTRLLALLRQHGVAPRQVRIELTEGALIDNPEQVGRQVERLRAAGVLTALDDFGSGYSSLAYLHRFRFATVKIDRAFVADLEPGEQAGSAAVVRAVLMLAQAQDLEVVAEGIETAAQCEALRRLGCTLGQGYHFARPQPVDAVLASRSAAPPATPAAP